MRARHSRRHLRVEPPCVRAGRRHVFEHRILPSAPLVRQEVALHSCVCVDRVRGNDEEEMCACRNEGKRVDAQLFDHRVRLVDGMAARVQTCARVLRARGAGRRGRQRSGRSLMRWVAGSGGRWRTSPAICTSRPNRSLVLHTAWCTHRPHSDSAYPRHPVRASQATDESRRR